MSVIVLVCDFRFLSQFVAMNLHIDVIRTFYHVYIELCHDMESGCGRERIKTARRTDRKVRFQCALSSSRHSVYFAWIEAVCDSKVCNGVDKIPNQSVSSTEKPIFWSTSIEFSRNLVSCIPMRVFRVLEQIIRYEDLFLPS